MAMIWDALLVSALAGELKTLLRDARLRGHRFRWEERELSLFFREGTLKWHLHPRKGWLTFSPDERRVPEDARPLSAELLDVTSPPDERLLEIRFQRVRGRSRVLRLVVELLTNQWNALLLEGEEGRIRHLLWTRRLQDRLLAVGQAYHPPEPSGRRGIHAPLTEREWHALLQDKSPEETRATLLEELAYTSTVNVEWLMRGAPPSNAWDPAGLSRWKELRNPIHGQPCILEIGGDKQPYPIIIDSFKHTVFPNLMTAIEAASRDQVGNLDPADEILERLERALQRARARARGIRKEMAQAADPEEPRDQANLLLARLGEVPRGAESVLLEGFEGGEVRIALDPTRNPQENAQALYQEAARRERARDRLPPLLEDAERAVLELELLNEELERGSISPLEASARIPGKRPAPGPGRKQETRTPFRRYISSGGLEIRVGRSSRENDTLTFRHAHPQDIWLHARDRAGAHVVLRWREEGNPPHRDLAEAAILAAVFSGARTSGTVPVDWTRRKYVRKPRKAPPGTVVPEQTRTLFVEPDPGLPGRLKPGGEEGG
jgi:predicted ribosome quality control (RQC) complex YloA/Tae2 family protein